MATAGTSHDLVLNGEGYMLLGGAKGGVTYKKKFGPPSVGLSPGSATNFEVLNGPVQYPVAGFRRAVWSKWSGLGQGMVAGSDGWQKAQQAGIVNDLVNLKPVQDGGALALVPQNIQGQVTVTAPGFTYYSFAFLNGFEVVALDAQIFKSANPGTNNTGLSLLATASAAVRGCATYRGQYLIGIRTAIQSVDTTTGVITAFATAHTGELLYSYQDMLFATVDATLYWYNPYTTSWSGGLVFETNIRGLEEFDGALYVGTDTGLWKITGQLKAKSPSTAPTVLDWFDYQLSSVWRCTLYSVSGLWAELNFHKMTAWKGYLWAFVSGQLFRIRPGSNASTFEAVGCPVYGVGRGIAVCGRYLVVACYRPNDSAGNLFCNETGGVSAWWKANDTGVPVYPFPNSAYPPGLVSSFVSGVSTTNVFRWLFDQSSPVGWKKDNYSVTRTAVTGKVTLPLITPEDLADLAGASNGKVYAVNLRRVGLEWSLIDGGSWWPNLPPIGAELSAFNSAIEVSNNAGVTWTTLAEPTLGSLSFNLFWFYGNRYELPVGNSFYQSGNMYPSAPPSGLGGVFGPVPDMGWLIRITWGGLVMPLLRRVWLDYDVFDIEPVTGRVWEFDINLADPLVNLDSSVDADTGLVRANLLTTLNKNGTSVTFSDLDGTNYLVKLTGLEIRRTAPGALPGVPIGWQASVKLEEMMVGNG